MRKTIVILSCIIFFSLSAYAFFEKDIRVLTMQNGLADNTVSSIHKDRDGFMWFGTDNGLSRYDGKNIKNFATEEVYLKVSRIRETSNSLLWINANNKLYCFNRRTESFLPIRSDRPFTGVNDVLILSDSSFWAITNDVVLLISIDYEKDMTGDINGVNLKIEKEITSLAGDDTKFLALCHSPEGILYIGTDWGTIFSLDPATYRITNKNNFPKVRKVHINRLLYSEGYIWIATWIYGAIRYNIDTGYYTQFAYKPEDKENTLSHGDVYQIVEINNGRYLATTWNGYTLLVPDKDDPTRFTTEVYNNTASQLHRNLETRMISAYYDPEGIIWVGTQGGGVYASDLRKQFYLRFHQETHNEICGMVTDNDQHIWLASFHKGILKSKEPFDPLSRLSFEPVASGTGNTVLSVVADKKGDLWFGNNRSELIHYHSDNKQLTVLPIRVKGIPKWSGSVWSLYCDSLDRLWLGTTDGLLLLDRSTGLFTSYAVNPGTIRTISGSPGNCLWLGTTHGLKKFSFNDNSIKAGYEVTADIPAREIRSLYPSPDGMLYIGYTDGFGIMNMQSDSIESFYTTHNGLSSNFIGSIIEDTNGHLWLGSNSSVIRYSKHQKLFYNYYISGNNRSVMLYDDYLFWGNNKNITYFKPGDAMNDHPTPDKVVITQLDVDNKPVEIRQKVNNQIILEEGIPYIHELTLTAANNSFSLMFSNLTYSEDLQKYSYRLSPAHADWLTGSDGEKVSYANLPQGDYLFEVRSILPDGSNGQVTSLVIHILPYWYETIWFRLLLIVMVAVIVFYLINRIKKEQIRLTREERLKHELFVANLEREKEKQINRERGNFFTNVSHELRTPLTLILSPLQELLQTERLSSALQDKLSLVYNNATSLSTLVNQLLYVQKIEAGMVQLYLSESEIVALVRKVMASFRYMAEIKRTEFIFDSAISSLHLWIDISKVESALKNLLSNAFKYTPDCGTIKVSLAEKDVDGKMYCVLSVADNGPGIAVNLQERIFDSFITGDNDPSFSTQVGIGLRIVKNTMDLHHGKVLLHSSVDTGSEFVLYFPLGKEHFKDDNYLLINDSAAKYAADDLFQVVIKRKEKIQSASGKKLLIIEDNEEIRQYIHTLFEKNYRVLEARDGEEGIKVAREEIPDLIISDIMMPVKDGFASAQEIRQDMKTAHIPIIMLTAKAEEEDLLKSTRIGVDDYIMKPFNPEVLIAKVENLIGMREQLKRIYTKTLMLKHTEKVEETEDPTDPFMQQVIGIVEANLTNPDFSAKSLAGQLNLSQPTLYRKMKQQSNLSIIEVIRSIRISKAASLIMQKKYSIQEVAEMVGYNDINTFRKHFTNQFGVSPSRYNSL